MDAISKDWCKRRNVIPLLIYFHCPVNTGIRPGVAGLNHDVIEGRVQKMHEERYSQQVSRIELSSGAGVATKPLELISIGKEGGGDLLRHIIDHRINRLHAEYGTAQEPLTLGLGQYEVIFSENRST